MIPHPAVEESQREKVDRKKVHNPVEESSWMLQPMETRV